MDNHWVGQAGMIHVDAESNKRRKDTKEGVEDKNESTESHHMQTPCQIILWSCLINLLGTFSTAYLPQPPEITEQSPYLSPIPPWLLSVLLPDYFIIYITFATD